MHLGAVQQLTGDYPAAAATLRQALALCRDLGDRFEQAHVHTELAAVQRLAGDYRSAVASHQQALNLCRDAGNRLGLAETLNCLGELASRTADGRQARDRHAQALAIARDLGTLLEEGRALEGTGHSHLHDANPTQAAAPLRDALAIYQRIASPAARRVEETLRQREPPHIGYLLTCPRAGARPGSVQVPGSSLSHRLPALVAWLSFGLRGPGAVMGRERLKRGLRSSK